MQTEVVSSRTQKLIAVGAVVALALISFQAYMLMANGALATPGIPKASGTTDPPTNSTITVTGSGQVEILPSMALLTMGVTTQDPSAQTAAQQNANIMANVITALENLGINSSSIQTVSYNVYPQTDYTTGKSFITGYQVQNEVQVTITASGQSAVQLGAKAGSAIDAAVGQGANQVYGVQFTVSNAAMRLANQQVLQMAVKDASGQANAIATALGVTVTGVISVSTSPAYTPSSIIQYAASAGSSQTPIVAPQSLTVSASVQAVYAIS